MSYRFIEFETVEEHIAVITLNRPERLNALNGPLLEELLSAIRTIEEDADIRVFLLTGAPRADGRPCFSAGVDLKAAAEGIKMDSNLGPTITNDIDDMLKPSIAVIDGVCSTGAVELALSCDLRLVGGNAQISDWHLKNLGTGLGGWGASTRWSRLVGAAATKEIVLTGKVVDGDEAFRIGFATRLYPSERLWDEAMAMARTIAGMRPEGVALTLSHLDHNMDMSRDQALRWAKLSGKWLGVTSNLAEAGRDLMGRKTQEP
ncbi:MAG: enoyl-CoA hydratase/isomerase family protein [Chloroflexi bacterium]|nr:enoyl-CoA hydratase/isomerase family protein [Chloroflexota bacterium]